MRGRVITLVAALAVGAGGPLMTAVPAAAAGRGATVGSCGLPGLVRTTPAQRCPASAPSVPGSPSSSFGLTGWLLGGLLSGVVSWVDHGAAAALRFTSTLIASTTRPELLSTWFSTTYARVATLSVLLTLPFLFAAAVHALVRSELALLGRAAFGYLPLAMLGVVIAAPLVTLLLSATDEMCTFVAGASGGADASFLTRAAAAITAGSLAGGDPFLAFFVGLITVAATVSLWIELLIRAAAVEVVVLMLPLFFAAMVWPARRVWAIRAIETLVALVLAKLAIVAVLALGGAALGSDSGTTAALTGATLVMLAVLSPWALLRLLPLHEVAAAAAGGLSQAPRGFADTMRGGAFGGGPSASGGGNGDGLGPEDERSAAFARMTSAASTGLDIALGTFGRRPPGARRSVGGAARGPGAEGTGAAAPLAADGLDALPSPGTSGAGGAGWSPRLDPTLFGDAHDDGRPPINESFDGRPWDGFVIGEEGDDVMRPPRVADEGTRPVDGGPRDGGAGGPRDGGGGPRDRGAGGSRDGGGGPAGNTPNAGGQAGDEPPPDITPPPPLGSEDS